MTLYCYGCGTSRRGRRGFRACFRCGGVAFYESEKPPRSVAALKPASDLAGEIDFARLARRLLREARQLRRKGRAA